MFFDGTNRYTYNSDASPYGSTGFQPVSYGMTPQGNCWCTSWDTSADDCATLTYSAGYVYADADGLGAPVAVEDAGGGNDFIATDPQGNVIYQARSSSRIVLIKYDAYGNVYNTSAGDLDLPFRFAGMRCEKDADIYLTPNRAYSPALGRWLSPDPLGTLPNPKQGNRFSPTSQYTDGQNLYEYCAGDPVNERDLRGLSIGSNITAIFFRRLSTVAAFGGIGILANHFIASDSYDIWDYDDEFLGAFNDQIDSFYYSNTNGHQGHTKFSPTRAGDWIWENPEGKMLSAGWWLHGSNGGVTAEGEFDYCCFDRKCKLSNVSVLWTWNDVIDAYDFKEVLDEYEEIESEGIGWLYNASTSFWLSTEAFWDILGDKIMNTDFGVKVKWAENRKEPITIEQ